MKTLSYQRLMDVYVFQNKLSIILTIIVLVTFTSMTSAYSFECNEKITNLYNNNEELYVCQPFIDNDNSNRKINDFLKMVQKKDKLPEEKIEGLIKNLIKVISYGYSFEDNVTCPKYIEDDICFRNDRIISIDLSDIKGVIEDSMSQFNSSACSTVNLQNINDIINKKHIYSTSSFYVRVNACGDLPFDGEWKINIDSGTISIHVVISLLISSGSLEKTNNEGKYKVEIGSVNLVLSSTLGSITRSSVLANVITKNLLSSVIDKNPLIIEPTTKLLNSTLLDFIKPLSLSSININYEILFSKDLENPLNYDVLNTALNNLDRASLTYLLNGDLTRFIPSMSSYENNKYNLAIVDSSYYPMSMKNDAVKIKTKEISSLKTLGDDSKRVLIKKGETLESIAKRHFGNKIYTYIILEFNPNITDMNKILSGQEIIIPPLYEILNQSYKVIKPGDNLWSLCSDDERKSWNYDKLILPTGSKNPDLIYPFQLFKGCFDHQQINN